jgi:multidrug resistance protein, MATE family
MFAMAVRDEVPGVFRLALPIVAGLAASSLLGVTDSIMLAPLGAVPLAAVGVTSAVLVIFFAAIYGILSALSVRIGAAHGARAGRSIPAILRNGLMLGWLIGGVSAVAMGAVWFLLPRLGQPPEVLAAMPAYYAAMALMLIPFSVLTVFKSAFEAMDRPWLGAGFALLATVINIPLNYALIWGIGPFPQLGLTGAGIASLASEGLALLTAWGYWARARSLRRLRLRRALDLSRIAQAAREGAPLGAMYVAETGAMAVATILIGTFGTVALAGNQVAMSVDALVYMLPLGVAGAVAIRVAQAEGAGEAGRLRPIAFAALAVALVWLIAAALVLMLFGRRIAGLISDDPAVVDVAASVLLVIAPMLIADSVQSTMLGALRGISDTAYPALVSMIAFWGIALPAGWLIADRGGMGPAGIWAGFLIGLSLAGAMLAHRFVVRTRLRVAASSL